MSILITQSLAGNIDFYKTANAEWKDRAYASLKNTLGRVWTGMSEPAQRGVDFENTIYNLLRAKKSLEEIGGSEYFQQIVKACEGGKFQEKIKFFLTIDDVEYCMYGKLDVLKPELIIDVKTTGKWNRWSEEKYYKSLQHHMYCFGKKIPKFEYHVAVFNDPDKKIQQYHIIPYDATTWAEEETLLIKKVREMRDFLEGVDELNELWKTKYSKY